MAKAPPITAEMLEGLDETIDTRLADLKRLKRANRKRILRNAGSALRRGDQPMESGEQDPSARWKRQMELYDKEKEILDSLSKMEGDLLKLQEEKGVQSREYIAKAAQVYGSMVELRAADSTRRRTGCSEQKADCGHRKHIKSYGNGRQSSD